jgi:hypothetical protein
MRKDQITKELIEEFGLPEDTKFMCYIIQLESSDEFLVDYNYMGYMWIMGQPGQAKRFKDPQKAKKIAKDHAKGARVCYLVETQKQYIVFQWPLVQEHPKQTGNVVPLHPRGTTPT